jgi:hypothetical protein
MVIALSALSPSIPKMGGTGEFLPPRWLMASLVDQKIDELCWYIA